MNWRQALLGVVLAFVTIMAGYAIYWYATHECVRAESYIVPAHFDYIPVGVKPVILVPQYVPEHRDKQCVEWRGKR